MTPTTDPEGIDMTEPTVIAGFEVIESDAVPDDSIFLVGSHLDENNQPVIDAAMIRPRP